MPRSIVIFRLATGLVTLALVAMVMRFGDGSPAAKWVAGGVLVFGLMQWLFLGRLGKAFSVDTSDGVTLDAENEPR